ncbi:MAG TPA: hypothetical protein PLM98_14905 [Thiolinea sp.]|nr:hypothetical protein [Thiolinea sp.]
MKKAKLILGVALSALFYTHTVLAEQAIKVSATTLGYSVNYVHSVTETINIRAGVNSFNHKADLEERYLKYNGKFDFQSYQAIFDWHPYQSWFYVSGGVVYNQNKVTLKATPKNGTYVINGKEYTVNDVGTLNGSLTFDRLSPYVGVGLGNPIRGFKDWSFSAEAGVLIEGIPKTTLGVRCGAGLTTGNCSQLQGDVEIEKKYLKNAFDDYKLYPVVSLGISYRF